MREIPTPSCTRRDWLALATACTAGTALPVAWAGAQLEEPLADSVRSALSAAVSDLAPPEPIFASTDARMEYLRWLTTMSDKLQRRMPDWEVRRDFLQTVWYESKRAGLEVSLVLGLVQVESGFRKFAVSVAGARGFMQIMPFWMRVIGDGDAGKLFHMQTNLRFGCVILRHYLERERGDMFLALGRYNGSRGKDKYPNLVFGAQRQWRFDPNAPRSV
jgi:soluble lytic murein transglycosylase-like protein